MDTFEMFQKRFSGESRRGKSRLINELKAKALISEFAKRRDLEMIRSLVQLELQKEAPNPEIVAYANQHVDQLLDTAVLVKGKTGRYTTLSFSDAELDIIERALQKELKKK